MKSTCKSKKYFAIFPLNSLSLNISFEFLINCIMDYFIINKLKRMYKEKYITYWVMGKIFDNEGHGSEKFKCRFTKIQKKVREGKPDELVLVYLRYRILDSHNKWFKNKYKGNDALVGIYIDVLNDILTKKALSERQFRILCAIYSKIGKSPYQIIYNDEIRIRAFGYKSKRIYEKEIERINRKISLYSNKLLLNEILILKEGDFGRKFFDRVSDGRKYYYSIKLRSDDLDYIVKYKLYLNKARREEEKNRYRKLKNDIKRGLDVKEIKRIRKFIKKNMPNSSYSEESDKFIKILKQRENKIGVLVNN